MKKVIIVMVILLGCLGIILCFNPSITYVNTKGYVVPDTYNVSASYTQSEGQTVYLHELVADSMVYSSLFKDYDYETNTAIDTNYPMYTNDGATLSFLFNDFWLVSDDFDFLETYEGLYLTDGNTYNEDLSLADGDEFLLVSLDNGLYMNAQYSSFQGPLGETAIPANSIIQFTSTNIRFYEFGTGELSYSSIEEVYSGTITIGDHTYDYIDFLKALDLFQEAIEKLEKDDDIYEIQKEIEELLGDDDNKSSNSAGAGQASDGTGDTALNSDGERLSGSGSNSGAAGSDGSSSSSGSSSNPSSSSGSGSSSGGSGSGSGSGAGSSSSSGSGSGSGSGGSSGSAGSSSSGSSASSGSAGGDSNSGDGLQEGTNNNSGVVGEGNGESPEVPYQVPTVSIANLDSWAYAINGDLIIDDPSGVFRKGVSLTVYGAIKGAGASIGTVDGLKVYSSSDYTGSSAKLRKTFYSGQEFTLNGIQPDTDFYVQYSYSYYALVDSDDGETVYTVVSVVSDFYLISTPTIEASNLPTINLTYDTSFAAYSDRMELQNLYLENDSAYDAEDTSFANFKLNVLPYISKLTFDFAEDGVNDITISSSTVTKATVDGITFTSSANSLSSNTEHKYTVTATDKYGNELPLNINTFDYSKYTGVVYTAKKQPSITVEEVENITDSLTVKITISDSDGALIKTDSVPDALALIVTDTSGNTTSLTGTWENGETLTSVNNILYLEEPTDGKEYTFTVDSLAFARTYTFSVYGDYDPQPDVASTPVLGVLQEQLFGSGKIYTAAMSTGSIDVSVSLLNALILDTSAVIGLEITNKSNTEVLALVDELRITITDTANNAERVSLVLAESELSQLSIDSVDENQEPLFTYDEVNQKLIISDSNGIEVSFVGAREEFSGKSLWEVLIVSQTTDVETGTTSVSDAVQLSIDIDEGLLESFTSHAISYQAIVMKSGIEYSIPVTLSSSTFQTKKMQPSVVMDDTFIANDVLEFIDLYISDIDGAIVGTGAVEVRLYINDTTLLQKVTVYANGDLENVRFEGLTPGLEYTVQVVALEYNNSSGYSNYTTNFVLATYDITAGSDIQATITLNSLDYVYENRSSEPVFSVSGSEAEEGLSDGGSWSLRTDDYTDGCYTGKYALSEFDLGEGDSQINVLEISYQPDNIYSSTSNIATYPNVIVRFYDASGNYIYWEKSDYSDIATNVSSVLLTRIPDGAVSISFGFGDLTYLQTYGFDVYGYHMDVADSLVVDFNNNSSTTSTEATPNKYIKSSYGTVESLVVENTWRNSTSQGTTLTNTSYDAVMYLPVTAGEVYFAEDYFSSEYIYYYNNQKEYIGFSSPFLRNAMFVVPENVSYISFFVSRSENFELYKVADAEGESGAQYLLDASIDVYDKKGSLLDEDSRSTVYLALERSESINVDVTGEESYEEVMGEEAQFIIDLIVNEDGSYSGSYPNYQAYLDPDCSYRLSVKAIYNGEVITITSQVLETDGSLIIINNASDFSMIQRYPYANFLVTADFEVTNYYSFNFHGTIDFDGHTITYTGENGSYLINTLGTTGVLKNLVFKNTSGTIEPIVYTNYGTIENVLVETEGTIESDSTYRGLIAGSVNYGTIKGFVIALGGDVYIRDSNVGLVVRLNQGTIENGYIYNKYGGAVIIDDSALTYAGGMVAENSYNSGTIKNVYSVYDTYINLGTTTMGYSITNYNRGNLVNHIYHVGDYFEYSVSQGKTYTALTNRKVINNVYSAGISEQIWSVSSYDYEPSNDYDDVKTATVSQLADVTWESQVLTDGFDVEGTVSMGFYPRLEWPTCMEQHQEYRVLPSEAQDSVPSILSDRYTEDTTIYNNNAYITLSLTNPNSYLIQSVAITGLTTTVISQKMGETGLYEVTLLAEVSEDPLVQEYVSAYTVESLVYNNGSSNRTTTSDYVTENISFYKTVGSASDWYSINNNLDWNYRLTSNIAFTSYSELAGIVINGSTTSFSNTSNAIFTGTIDGAGYQISGIRNENTSYPYVFYRLGSTASIYNLYIDDLTLTGTSTQSSDYAGFIGYVYMGAMVEDVHMSNVTINASGYMGALAGYFRGTALNCTFNDIDITLKTNRYTIAIGGIAGYCSYGVIENCYGKNINIEAKDVSGTVGTGGLVGYGEAMGMYNCYVQGSISTDSAQVGGAAGKTSSTASRVSNVVTDVEISTTSGSVGGVIGANGAIVMHNVALGDIFAGTSNVHRITGLKDRADYSYYPSYAYKGQIVNTLSSDDNDDAMYLYTSEELATVKTWVDGMSYGSQWSYTDVTDGKLPKLYYRDTTTLLPGQEEGVTLPGNASFTVTLDAAGTENNVSESTWYYANVIIQSEDMDAEQLEAALESGTITFSIEGMDMSADATNDGRYTYSFSEASTGGVLLSIKTQTYTYAYDTYKLIVTSGDVSTTTIIDYGVSLYHQIPNITVWNEYMQGGHHNTVENFEVTGEIDFTNATVVSSLMLGNLKGNDSAKFTNLYFATSDSVSGNWILSCNGIDNIDFENIVCDFSTTPSYQTMGSVIGYCNGGFTNCDISNIKITSHSSKAGGVGLCYQITGNVDEIDISDVEITVSGTTERSYHGSIAGYLYGSFSNIVAKDITVEYGYGNSIGGLFGYVNGLGNSGNTQLNENIDLTNITVVGRQNVGGMVGYSTQALQLQNITADAIDVEGKYTAGGIGGTLYFSSTGYTHNNISIQNSKVVSTQVTSTDTAYNTGGIFGYAQYSGIYYDLFVDNVTVEGYGRVGGVVGCYDMLGMDGVYVTNTTVTQHNESSTADVGTGAGGIAGRWQRDNTIVKNAVVRDTTIVADYNAGGVLGFGYSEYRMNVTNTYIAEDVTITATKNNAGGIVGYHNEFQIYESAVGANITAMGSNAGGVVGYLYGSTTPQTIDGVYVSGEITSSNYTGGVIGYVADDVTLTSTQLAGTIVTADLTSSGAIDVVANFKDSNSYQSGKIGVWENLLINGQTLQSLYRESTDTSDTTKTALRAGVSMLSASTTATEDDFLQKSTYTTYGIDSINTAYLLTDSESDDGETALENIYMPFILDSTDLTNLKYSDSYEGSSVGILRPEPGERTGATVVYVSGVNQINIETTQDSVDITVPTGKSVSLEAGVLGGLVSNVSDSNTYTYTYTFDASDQLGGYNVITMGYDFASEITVDNVTYTSDDLARTVMTYGSYWHYIGESEDTGTETSLYYGGSETRAPQVEDELSNPIHLWQGKVLTSSDTIYESSDGLNWSMSKETVSFGEIKAVKTPIFDGTTYDIYYHFSMAGNTSYGYRIYSLSGTLYTVYPTQGALYDGYILSTQSGDTYYALLSESSGRITNYLTSMVTGSFINNNITQISNNFKYTLPIVVVRYTSGNVVVLNYVTGEILYETPETSIVAFGYNLVNGLINTMSGTAITTDDSYASSNALLGTYISSGGTDGDAETAQAGNGESISEDGADVGVVDIKDQEDGGDEASDAGVSSGSSSLGDEDNYVESNGGISLTSLDVGGVDGIQAVAGIDGDSNDSNEISSTDNTGTADAKENLEGEASDGTGDADSGISLASIDADEENSRSDDASQLTAADGAEGSGSGSSADSGGDTASGGAGADASNGLSAVADTANSSGDSNNAVIDSTGNGSATDSEDNGSSDTDASEEESGSSSTKDDSDSADLEDAEEDDSLDGAVGSDGTGINGSGNGEDDTTDGTTEADETATGADGDGGATDDTGSDNDQTGSDTDGEVVSGDALADLDYMLAYNPFTGNYEVYDTEEFSTSSVTSESKNSAMERFIEELLKVEEEADGENNFVVRKLSSNILSTDERNGFILLSIIALSCIIVLIVMHVKVRKR